MRVLDCQQCFDSKGKFCHHKEYNTGESKRETYFSVEGHEFCCAPDETYSFCGEDKNYECSPPSFEANPTSSEFAKVLTGDRNY